MSQPQTAAVTIAAVARPVFHPEIGKFFRKLREDRGIGLRQAADMADRKRLKALTLNSLGKLERGGTKNPEPALLREIATLYGMSYDDVVIPFLSRRYGVDLPRHGNEAALNLSPEIGGSDAADAQARIRELHQQLWDQQFRFDRFIEAMQEIQQLMADKIAGTRGAVSPDDAGSQHRESATRKRAARSRHKNSA